MALQKPILCLFRNKRYNPLIFLNVLRRTSDHAKAYAIRVFPSCYRDIGCREIVGHGINGDCSYVDNVAFPFPAIRFREVDDNLKPLKEKEKGDWRNLTLAEKKTLYRASYCQTFAEILVPSKEWKSILGKALVWVSLGIWLYVILQEIWGLDLPDTFREDKQEAQLRRMLTLEINPIHGLSSKWDYDENSWKV